LSEVRKYRPVLADDANGEQPFCEGHISELSDTYAWLTAIDREQEKHARLFYALHQYEIAHEMRFAELQAILLSSGLESLFTTDSQEATEKLALRTAWFLESDQATRERTYRQVKDLYRLRSQYAHGGTGKRRDAAKVKSAIRDGELLLHRCLQKIRKHQLEGSFSKQKVADYLVSLTLGGSLLSGQG
jgi:hypothetical protein